MNVGGAERVGRDGGGHHRGERAVQGEHGVAPPLLVQEVAGARDEQLPEEGVAVPLRQLAGRLGALGLEQVGDEKNLVEAAGAVDHRAARREHAASAREDLRAVAADRRDDDEPGLERRREVGIRGVAEVDAQKRVGLFEGGAEGRREDHDVHVTGAEGEVEEALVLRDEHDALRAGLDDGAGASARVAGGFDHVARPHQLPGGVMDAHLPLAQERAAVDAAEQLQRGNRDQAGAGD